MHLTSDSIFILAVVLLTWGGVFAYMLRLDNLTGTLERKLKELREESH